eukprot:CAMPEP_0117500008 /NCGR_PEP_ID=MMETSP0784-20121206/22546_1 /TAXON_ID=39447 /ORGANISM="" /LENGTH=110 /DNA_ID=CAMNT_0005295187 /DNA_START=95 /DNA_END=427 /DNA_ORIENTATION=+
MAAARRRSSVLLAAALLVAAAGLMSSVTFLQPSSPRGAPSAAAAVGAAPVLSAALPAVAGEPPSVGEHWYWDLGIGSLHGETASIILLVFFILVVLSLAGMGGSSKKSVA